MPIVYKSGPSLQEEDVVVLESRIGAALPLDYRNFILQFNGGRVRPDCFDFGKDGWKDHGMVNWFLQIGGDTGHDMYRCIEVYRDRMPAGYLAIAADPGGNLVLMSVQEENRGEVYFWDHEEEAEEGELPDDGNMAFVARDFTNFYNSLYDPGPLP